MSQRKAIRHALAEIIATPDTSGPEPVYPTAAGNNVFVTRSAPLHINNMPAVLVYTGVDRRDLASPYNQPGGPVRRILTVFVEAVVAGANADDDVDDICDELEKLWDADMNLGGLCESVQWVETLLEPAGDGAHAVIVAQNQLEIAYYTAPEDEDPGTLPDQVFISQTPDVGPGNEDKYEDVTEGQLP